MRYIATHIGRSHKRNLSPRERHEQIVAGQCCCLAVLLSEFWPDLGQSSEIWPESGQPGG